MSKRHKQLMTSLFLCILFVTVVPTIGCRLDQFGPFPTPTITPSPTLTPTPSPTPIPVPMVRITIQLEDVYCNSKQSVWWFQSDHFYMMSTFTAFGSTPKPLKTQPSFSRPIPGDIGDKEEMAMTSPTVFDGVVPQHGSVRGGFLAYNDSQGLNWSQANAWASHIAVAISDTLLGPAFQSGNGFAIAGAVILTVAANVWNSYALPASPSKDLLGKHDFVVPATGPVSEEQAMTFFHSGGPGNNWSYTVKYHITRTSVPDSTTSPGN